MEQYTATMSADLRQSFHDLLERHRKIVFKVANSYARGVHDRADLAQEIATQLWRAFPGYDGTRLFSTWMYRVALNVAISYSRRARRESDAISLDESDIDFVDENASRVEPDERVRALHAFIARLDPLNRALLLLYLEEKPQREIADILGITETNVATKIGRLKQRIRNDMANT